MRKSLLFVISLLFIACGSENTYSDINLVTVGADVVETKMDLPNCDEKMEGRLAFVSEENALIYCLDGSWTMQQVTESETHDTIYKLDTLRKINRVVDTLYKEIPPKLKNQCSVVADTIDYHRVVVTCDTASFSAVNKNAHLTATVYGEDITDERDGHVYKTVVIGNQTWMAENLNYAADSSFCHDDIPENCEEFGRMYKWAAAMGSTESECGSRVKCPLSPVKQQGVCPKGFHLPQSFEFQQLIDFVEIHNGVETAIVDLLSLDGGRYFTGHDLFGFDLKPAPSRTASGKYWRSDRHILFWTAEEANSGGAICWVRDDGFATVFSGYYGDSNLHRADACSKFEAVSVRCVKD